jgi:hypothetical protein
MSGFSAPVFLRLYCPSLILSLMSISSILLPAVDYSTRISIPVSTIIIFMFMYEEAKELGGHTRYWLMVNLLFSLAVVIEFVFVGPKYKYRSIYGENQKVDSFQLEQIRLSVTRSKFDRRSFCLFSFLYLIFVIVWFSIS